MHNEKKEMRTLQETKKFDLTHLDLREGTKTW
jgi:hypothetical protein